MRPVYHSKYRKSLIYILMYVHLVLIGTWIGKIKKGLR